MENKTYDKLKWIALVIIPALGTFVGTVGLATAWQYTDLSVTIIFAFGTLLGSALGVSNQKYNNNTIK